MTMRELSVVGVRVELPANQPILLLKEVDGERRLWIVLDTQRVPQMLCFNLAGVLDHLSRQR